MSDEPDELKDTKGSYGFDLPVAPAWFSKAPQGTMDDGIRLSLAALEQVKDRPEIFARRQRQMCDVEFVV